MDVSHTEHSHVIGKGGNNIKRVMEETGCHIHFPDSNRNNQAEKSNQVCLLPYLGTCHSCSASVRASVRRCSKTKAFSKLGSFTVCPGLQLIHAPYFLCTGVHRRAARRGGGSSGENQGKCGCSALSALTLRHKYGLQQPLLPGNDVSYSGKSFQAESVDSFSVTLIPHVLPSGQMGHLKQYCNNRVFTRSGQQ